MKPVLKFINHHQIKCTLRVIGSSFVADFREVLFPTFSRFFSILTSLKWWSLLQKIDSSYCPTNTKFYCSQSFLVLKYLLNILLTPSRHWSTDLVGRSCRDRVVLVAYLTSLFLPIFWKSMAKGEGACTKVTVGASLEKLSILASSLVT